MNNGLNQFAPDYIFSWDFNKRDVPCVSIIRLRRDKTTIVADSIGVSFENCGAVSLRQVLEEYETRERDKAEREKNRAELLRKVLKEDADHAEA